MMLRSRESEREGGNRRDFRVSFTSPMFYFLFIYFIFLKAEMEGDGVLCVIESAQRDGMM